MSSRKGFPPASKEELCTPDWNGQLVASSEAYWLQQPLQAALPGTPPLHLSEPARS